jgi:hypothetical protein
MQGLVQSFHVSEGGSFRMGSDERPKGVRVEVDLKLGEGDSPVAIVLRVVEAAPQELQDTGM